MSRWRTLAAGTALLMVVGACGGGPFTIEEFKADTGCTADGVMEITASGQTRAVGDIEYFMISAGLPSPWCEGLVHRMPDGVEISGYVFDSEPGDPLEFVVEADGYVYLAGSGSVTNPDGKVTNLP